MVARDKKDLFPVCRVCGEEVGSQSEFCESCKTNYENPGVGRANGKLNVVLPHDYSGKATKKEDLERVARMLIERNYTPDEWVISHLTVNEWDAMRKNDLGVRKLEQTKATLVPKVVFEDTPYGQFAQKMADAIGLVQREPRKVLKPVGGKPRLTVLIGDDQSPHTNMEAHEAVCEALSDLKPDRIVYMGDGIDLDTLSRYDLEHPEWESTVSGGFKHFYEIMGERLDAAGNPESHFLEGNHEHRLQKWLLQKTKPLFGVKAAHLPDSAPSVLSIEYLGGLGALGMNYIKSDLGAYPFPGIEIAPEYYAYHGWVARQKGGMSAHATVDSMNSSVIVGHTHRLAISSVTRWVGEEPITYTAAETGTMANLRGLGYAKNPDWQSGFLTVTDWPDGHHLTEPATFKDGTLLWRDRRWTITPTGVRRG